MRYVPDSFGSELQEFNPCHEPAGSPEGGRFAPKGSCGIAQEEPGFPGYEHVYPEGKRVGAEPVPEPARVVWMVPQREVRTLLDASFAHGKPFGPVETAMFLDAQGKRVGVRQRETTRAALVAAMAGHGDIGGGEAGDLLSMLVGAGLVHDPSMQDYVAHFDRLQSQGILVGTAGGVMFDSSDIPREAAIMMHTHPGNTSFSEMDMVTAMRNGIRKLVVATQEGTLYGLELAFDPARASVAVASPVASRLRKAKEHYDKLRQAMVYTSTAATLQRLGAAKGITFTKEPGEMTSFRDPTTGKTVTTDHLPTLFAAVGVHSDQEHQAEGQKDWAAFTDYLWRDMAKKFPDLFKYEVHSKKYTRLRYEWPSPTSYGRLIREAKKRRRSRLKPLPGIDDRGAFVPWGETPEVVSWVEMD